MPFARGDEHNTAGKWRCRSLFITEPINCDEHKNLLANSASNIDFSSEYFIVGAFSRLLTGRSTSFSKFDEGCFS